jgi:hypothetical protein
MWNFNFFYGIISTDIKISQIREGSKMRKTEICRKMITLEDGRELTLVYSMTIDELTDIMTGQEYENYGVCVCLFESGETETIRSVTFSARGIQALLDLLATNLVTPATVGDVVYDWLSAN